MTPDFTTRPSAAEPIAGTGSLPFMLTHCGDPCAVLDTTPANADQAADTLKRLNLLGCRANDCADPTRTGVSYEIDANGSAFFINVVGLQPPVTVATSC